MNIKRIKIIGLVLVVIFIVLRLSIYIFRLPSYTIQTTGKLYIISKVSEDIQVVDLSTGSEIGEIPIDILSHEAVSTVDNKKIVITNYASNNGNVLKVLDVTTNTIEKTINLNAAITANGIVATPKPNEVAIIDYVNNKFLILNIENDRIVDSIATQQNKSHLVVLHPNKPIAYVTNVNSGSISVIDLNLGEVLKIIPCGLGRKGIDITPDGSELWVSNTKESNLNVINTSTYDITKTLKTGKDPIKLKFSVDGNYCLITNAIEGNVDVFNQQTKEKIKSIEFHGKSSILEKILYHTPRPVNIIMHPNGKYAFVSNSNAKKIEVIDMNTFTIVSTIGTGKVPDAMVFIP